MSSKHKVLFATNPARREVPTIAEFKRFEELFEVVVYPLVSIEQFQHALLTDLNDISAIWITKPLVHHATRLNNYIDYLPPTVKVIALSGVGYDMYDVPKLKSKGIKVCNIGDAPANDVADMALSLTLSTFRFTAYFDKLLRECDGDSSKTKRFLGSEAVDANGRPLEAPDERFNWTKFATIGGKSLESPNGKTAVIIGLGSIGKQIAIRLWALGMKIVYTKRTPLEEGSLPFDTVYYPTIEEALPVADLIVLAVPHTEHTVNIINRDSIKLVKRGVRIVNIGRGSAIDEDVLFEALDNGTVNSVGLDVFQHEPHIDKRYLNRHDVTISPHLGPFTKDNHIYIAKRQMENIINVLIENGDGINPV